MRHLHDSHLFTGLSLLKRCLQMCQVGVAVLPFFKHFLSFHLSRFSFYIKIKKSHLCLHLIHKGLWEVKISLLSCAGLFEFVCNLSFDLFAVHWAKLPSFIPIFTIIVHLFNEISSLPPFPQAR